MFVKEGAGYRWNAFNCEAVRINSVHQCLYKRFLGNMHKDRDKSKSYYRNEEKKVVS